MKLKFDFVKNRVVFLAICIFLATVLVLLSVWKQQKQTVEGMVVMDFLTASVQQISEEEKLQRRGDDGLSRMTDMDLQNFISALIPFEKKFETEEKAEKNIKEYEKGFIYDPSGNGVNMIGISAEYLENFINHLNKTSDSFIKFSDALKKMKKKKMDEYTQENQGLAAQSAQSGSPSPGTGTGSGSFMTRSAPGTGTGTGSGSFMTSSGSG